MTDRTHRLCFVAGLALLATGCGGAGTGSMGIQSNGNPAPNYVPSSAAAQAASQNAAVAGPLPEPKLAFAFAGPLLTAPIINDAGSYTNGPIIRATNTTTGYGMEGIADAAGAGVYGHSASTAANSDGVYGFSSAGDGVLGHAATTGNGVSGDSAGGTGVRGSSATGYGGYFTTSGGTALVAVNTVGDGNGVDSITNAGYAYYGSGSDVGALIQGTNEGIYGLTGSKGYPLVAEVSDAVVWFIDSSGTAHTMVAGGGGRRLLAYQPKSASPTIEDTGTAQLADGSARVALDSTFAQALDPGKPYQVMLTPDGDTRGLYVASKSATGFVVREVQGGRSSIGFDYHIYATEIGHANERMTLATGETGPRPALLERTGRPLQSIR